MPKSERASRNFYDVWLPELAPSEELLKRGRSSQPDDRSWEGFARRYRTEMSRPEPSRLLDLLSALSRQTSFSVGCYCADERRCHRSVLCELLAARGADLA